MSAFTKELDEFAERLLEGGYPPALVERASQRMQAMEDEILRLSCENWISVDDQLPEDGTDVLCYWKIMGPEEMHVLTYWPDESMWRRHMDDHNWDTPDYWRPLPKAPERVSEEPAPLHDAENPTNMDMLFKAAKEARDSEEPAPEGRDHGN